MRYENQLREFKLVSVRQYITMSIMSALIFVKVTLSLHGNKVLKCSLIWKVGTPHNSKVNFDKNKCRHDAHGDGLQVNQV